MFETNDSAEISVPSAFSEPGMRVWTHVKYTLHMPWFHVVCRFRYEDNEEEYALHQMMFFTRVEQLLQLQQERPQIQMVEIDLVSPGHMNGTDRWKLEPLAEIWEGTEPEAENQLAYVYVLEDGTRYFYSGLCHHENELRNLRRILKLGRRVNLHD